MKKALTDKKLHLMDERLHFMDKKLHLVKQERGLGIKITLFPFKNFIKTGQTRAQNPWIKSCISRIKSCISRIKS
ncbi:MAG: hypothetical protein ACWA5P_11190, partial [bacterium]